MNPPALRAPNGVMQDTADFHGAGKAYYDPSKITVPTLLVLGEWDRDTPPYMAQKLFPLLVNAPGKRFVMLAEGTHTIIMEKNRLKLFEAVQASSTRRAGRNSPRKRLDCGHAAGLSNCFRLRRLRSRPPFLLRPPKRPRPAGPDPRRRGALPPGYREERHGGEPGEARDACGRRNP